jgi:hypothetical protein
MGACNGRPGDGREGGTDKLEWSILQGYEAKSRETGINNIEYHKSDECNVVCLPSEGTGKRIWIMMDAKSPPFYKQIPDNNYSLIEGQFSEIQRRTNPTSTVLEAMRSHVRK